jgi:hypothetical protein
LLVFFATFEKQTKFMATSSFPSQTIPEKDKTQDWLKKHLDYAEFKLINYRPTAAKMTRLFDSYNGVKPPGSVAWLERTYGKQNRSKYIAYRLGRTKVDLLHGEWLKRPLSATVTTINSEAMSAKMAQMDFLVGAMIAKPELTDLKAKAGLDVMEGVPIPDSPEDPIWEKMSPKDKCEDIMQIMLDNQIIDLDVKKKLGDAVMNCIITNRCFMQVERDQTGEVRLHNIDPRDAIFEEIEDDDFLERSPLMGCRRTMPLHEVLMRYELTEEQKNTLENARQNFSAYEGVNGLGRGYMRLTNGEIMCDVIHIEWKSVTPEYYKRVKKSKTQMAFDGPDDSDTIDLEMDPIKYENNKAFHDKMVASGEYEIVVKYREEEYEATRIGGLVDTNMRRTYFQKRSVDKPAHIMSSSYFGYIHGRRSGITVSLQQMIENFDNMFDICMYQILKELARAKGKVLTFDRAALPVNRKVKDVMYQAFNDQFIDYDSTASGNFSQTRLDPASMFKEFDLGLSESFQYLLKMKQDIINTLNQISGINESRQGQTAASSTATNAQTDIANSRNITEALFYGLHLFMNRVMKGIVDSTAISWAFYKLEKGEHILGVTKFKFLQLTKEIGYRDYGVSVEDGGRYTEIKNEIKRLMEFSLNAKEIRPMDALNVLLSNTVAEMKTKMENSWIEMQKAIQVQNEQSNQAAAQQQQAALQTQIQIATENREDSQNAKKEEIVLKGQVQKEVDNNKARNDMYKGAMDTEADILSNFDPAT